MAVFILVGNWPDNIEVLMIWVTVGRMTFEQRRNCYGIQSAGGRIGVIYHSIQLYDCNWMKGVKNYDV